LRAQRNVFWDGRFQPAPVYDQAKLKSGNVVKGLAIVESVHTTVIVPPDRKYTVDQYSNGVMEEA
jgi:N-methylhydantoinase A/oxoprolinase/acetone carboxylase beta subunit